MEAKAQMNEEEEFEFRARMEAEAGQSTVDSTPADSASEPSYLAVAGNAAAKGAAGFGDMFLNAPVNAYNLAKAGVVLAGDAVGKDLRDDITITPQPNLLQKGFEKVGLIDPSREPRTPGQRILDMAVQSGVGMAVNPGAGALGIAKGIGLGVASGAAAGATKELTGSDLAATAVGLATPLLLHAATASKANAPILKNPTNLQTAKEGMAAGYVIPPSHVKPSFSTQRLESIAGKAATKQSANNINIDVTDRLVAKELGLPATEPLTPKAIQTVRDTANHVYEVIANLSPRAKQALDRLKETRLDASDNWMDYARSRRADARKAAVVADGKAAQLERVIDREAQRAGQPALVQNLRDARVTLSKVHYIQDAMNVGDGHISASYLGHLLDNGKPLTGNLKTIAKFAQAFPDVMRDASKVPVAGVSALDATLAVGLGTAGYFGKDDASGIALGALPLLRGPLRAAMLSQSKLGIPGTTGYQQRLLAKPPELNQALLRSILAGRAVADAAGERH